MSEAFRSSVAFRNDICDTVAQLEQRFTRPLPNKATVYVSATDSLYRLFKDLGSSFDALGSAIVVPADGSNNRWVQESAEGASPWAGIELATANATVTQNAPDAWIGLGSTAGSFSSSNSAIFAVSATTSILTYRGVPRQVTVEYEATILNTGNGTAIVAESAISHNNDVPANSVTDFRSAGQQAVTLADGFRAVVSGKRSLLLNPADTLRFMLRGTIATPTITIEFFSLSVAPQ